MPVGPHLGVGVGLPGRRSCHGRGYGAQGLKGRPSSVKVKLGGLGVVECSVGAAQIDGRCRFWAHGVAIPPFWILSRLRGQFVTPGLWASCGSDKGRNPTISLEPIDPGIAFERYQADIENELAEASLKAYECRLGHFIRWTTWNKSRISTNPRAANSTSIGFGDERKVP